MKPRVLGILISLLFTSACGTTIRPGYKGIKYISLNDGALEKDVRPEGFYFQWPWNDIITYNVTWQTKEETVHVLTAESLHIPASVAITFRPKDRDLYVLHTEIGENYYRDVIRPAFVTLVRNEFSEHTHNKLAQGTPEIESNILRRLQKLLANKPLEIDNIAITHIEFDDAVSNSISNKLAKEQVSKQKRFEISIAQQDAEIMRTKAQGVSDAIRIKAEGQAQATILKGKAQATAQKSITQTLDEKYLQYKAFDGDKTRYYFVPTGKNGMPIIIDAAK